MRAPGKFPNLQNRRNLNPRDAPHLPSLVVATHSVCLPILLSIVFVKAAVRSAGDKGLPKPPIGLQLEAQAAKQAALARACPTRSSVGVALQCERREAQAGNLGRRQGACPR